MKNMRENQDEIKGTIESVNELIEPIRREIEDDDELIEPIRQEIEDDDELESLDNSTKIREEDKPASHEGGEKNDGEYYEARYMEKIRTRCEYQLAKGSIKCR